MLSEETKKRAYAGTADTRRIAKILQWGAVSGVWGRGPQPPEARGSGGGAPSR